MSHLLRAYQTALARRPIQTAALTSAALFAAGDCIAQQAIQRKGANHNPSSTLRMGLYGGCIFGPAATVWFRFLERNVAVNIGRTSQTLIRVGCDQLLFAPMITSVFFSTMAVMEGKSPADKLGESYWTALKANWSLWPAVQTANFFFVPLHMRVLLVNVVSLGWNSYLGFLNMQKKPEEGIVEVVKEVEEGEKKAGAVSQA